MIFTAILGIDMNGTGTLIRFEKMISGIEEYCWNTTESQFSDLYGKMKYREQNFIQQIERVCHERWKTKIPSNDG